MVCYWTNNFLCIHETMIWFSDTFSMVQVIWILGLIVFSVQVNVISSVPYSRIRRSIGSSEDSYNNDTVFRETAEDSHKNLLRLEEYSSRLKNSVINPIFMDRYLPSQVDRKVCQKPAKCVPLNHTTCLGTRLPYSQTTLDLVEGVSSQEEIQVSFCSSQYN